MYSDAIDDDITKSQARILVKDVNRKSQKKQEFKGFGFSDFIVKGILKKGYKTPTPIQRKAIPVCLSGRDVVAMARTGSGKTAAFLLPILESLKVHSNIGPRALVMSSTRELALQTLKFTKELGSFTSLTAACILGGDRIDDQFEAMHSCPDIIIATPGRFLHIIMEMNFNLRTIEMVVFDEGDRLFELGFAEQLSEILNRLSENRQTMIFSATLPTNLLEFGRAKLKSPVVVRLDADMKLSPNLKLVYVTCLDEEKYAALLHLVKSCIPTDEKVAIFFATKHHAEYADLLFEKAEINATCVHSGLDSISRQHSINNFRDGSVKCLLVTDLAARGLDIASLDNVINFHFPAQSKLFVHRVGRVARAGKSGTSFSLVSPDEYPYLFDVTVLINRNFSFARNATSKDALQASQKMSDIIGSMPRTLINTSNCLIEGMNKLSADLTTRLETSIKAMKKYYTMRPKASAESVKRSKQNRDIFKSLPSHPIFFSLEEDGQRYDINSVLTTLRNVKVPTIFEFNGKANNTPAYMLMQKKRKRFDHIIDKVAKQTKISLDSQNDVFKNANNKDDGIIIQEAMDTKLVPDIPTHESNKEAALSVKQTNSQNYLTQIEEAQLDLLNDDTGALTKASKQNRQRMVWDRKKKCYVSYESMKGTANQKKIRTESGALIPASYKSKKYETWLTKSKQSSSSSTLNAGDNPINSFVSTIFPSMPSMGKRENFVAPKIKAGFIPGSSIFTPKYGSVMQFWDDTMPENEEEAKKKEERKKMTWRERQKAIREERAQLKKERGPGVQVMGTFSKREKYRRNMTEKQMLREAKDIRQANIENSHNQLRKPEQVVRARKERIKKEEKAKRLEQMKNRKRAMKRRK